MNIYVLVNVHIQLLKAFTYMYIARNLDAVCCWEILVNQFFNTFFIYTTNHDLNGNISN